MDKTMYPPSQHHPKQFHCLKNPLCSDQSFFPLYVQPLTITELFPVSIGLPSTAHHRVGTIQYVVFSNWLLSLSNLHLRFFSWLDSSFLLVLNNIALSGWTMVYPFNYCPISSPAFSVVNALDFGHSKRCVQFSSVTQSCLTLCDPMNRSTPGLPVQQDQILSLCISLMTYDVEHLFMCLFATYISSLMTYLYRSLSPLFKSGYSFYYC